MTAPIAWLYGIPVERIMDGRGATVANLWLLGIVALWRVILMSRVMTVIYNVPWLRAGGWILLAAALEVVIVLFFTGFGEALGRDMAGMRNSREQDLIIRILGGAFWVCVIAVPVLLILMKAVLEFKDKAEIGSLPSSRSIPWITLVVCAAVWAALAVTPQRELQKEWKYRSLLKRFETRDALAYLNTLDPEDWPPAKSFRPDPYEFEVWRLLPALMEQVTGDEKSWVQEKLTWVFETTFEHWYRRFSEEDYLKILMGIEKFKVGPDWIRGSGGLWRRPMLGTNLVNYLEGHGVKIESKESAK